MIIDKRVAGFIFLILLVSVVSAQNFPSYTDKYVNDFAGVLDSNQSMELKALFSAVDMDTTAEIVFVSVSDLQGYDISQYATELGHKWGVGKADKDNGIVILYATDIKKIYVAVGYGIEGILPDSKVGRLLDENYVPLRDSGEVSQGIVETGKVLAGVVMDNKEEVLSGQSSGNNNSGWLWVAFVIPLIIFTILIVFAWKVKQASIRKINTNSYLGFLEYKSTTDKNQKYVKIMDIVLFFVLLILFFIFGSALGVFGFVIFLMLYFWLANLIAKVFPKRCSKDGKPLKFWKKENGKNYYKCSHGHVLAISLAATGAGAMYGGFGGGHGGGSSFGGGGGFGGGGFGGGGAGR